VTFFQIFRVRTEFISICSDRGSVAWRTRHIVVARRHDSDIALSDFFVSRLPSNLAI
jgi:hypothetical protein